MQNIVYRNRIIEPSEELMPTIRIAPFSAEYLNKEIPSEDEYRICTDYFRRRFSRYFVLPKGRSCIRESLAYYHLQKHDVVTILTTSGNYYISGCVTKTIEEQCRWSREITAETKLLFINHEFGYPFTKWKQVESLGLPIIEDCAHSFFSDDGEIGRHGDFVIYSLPKAFPIQLGGILRTNVDFSIDENQEVYDYVINNIASEVLHTDEYQSIRLRNYQYLCEKLYPLGIRPFFKWAEGIVPGVFLFYWKPTINYPHLKVFMQNNGIESSVFYGQKAFFIPVHHRLSKGELDYMCDLLLYYSNKY